MYPIHILYVNGRGATGSFSYSLHIKSMHLLFFLYIINFKVPPRSTRHYNIIYLYISRLSSCIVPKFIILLIMGGSSYDACLGREHHTIFSLQLLS